MKKYKALSTRISLEEHNKLLDLSNKLNKSQNMIIRELIFSAKQEDIKSTISNVGISKKKVKPIRKNKLKYYRIGLGLSHGDLAAAIGVSKSTVAKWEQGIRVPSVEYREALKSFLRQQLTQEN